MYDQSGWHSPDAALLSMLEASTVLLSYSPADGRKDLFVARSIVGQFARAKIVAFSPAAPLDPTAVY